MANETSKTTSPGNASPTPQQIPLAQIRDLPGIVNIRTYTPKDLGGLVSSIQSVGVREPIIVRRSEDGTYQCMDPLQKKEQIVPLSDFQNQIYAVRVLQSPK